MNENSGKIILDKEMIRSVRINALLGRHIAQENIAFVMKTFDNDEWDDFIYELYCRRKLHHRLVISNTAIKVCRKIQKELDVLMFPVAERCTTSYKDAGAWSWFMRGLYPFHYGSSWSLRECARKDRCLVLGSYQEVIPETIK